MQDNIFSTHKKIKMTMSAQFSNVYRQILNMKITFNNTIKEISLVYIYQR